MDNKKALRMAVTLAIINMPLLAQAADVSPVRITDGSTYTMTADSVINTGSNTTGIFVGYKDGGTIVGDNVTVTSDGYGIQIQTYATGGVAGGGDCSIKLGKTIVEAKSSAVRVDSSSYGQKATVILGAGSILNSSANSAVYVTGKDSLLQIGDGSTVTGNSYGATGAALASSSGGKIEIGNGVTIGHDNIRGYDVNSIAVLSMDGNASQGQSNITIGDDSTIYAKGKGYGANAVQAGYLSYTGFNGVGTKQGSSGQISVGDKATIWTEGDESFAVYGIHADSTLYVGKDAEISTQGDKASAVRGGNITKVYDFTAAGGKITIDEGAEIKTLGDQSHGVDARYDGTLIELKKDAVITTVGSESHGVTALAGGTVILQDAAVTVDSTKDAYAFSAEGKDSDTAAVSTITGSGVYNIVGDIRAADGGILTLDLAEGSRFEGKAVLDSGNDSQSTLTMAKNSLWTLTGNSQLNSLQNEQSVIDMTGDNKAFSTLSVETLTGNGGTIIMDIDGFQVDASDKIYVTGDFSGSQTLSLKEINGLDSDPGIGQAAENTVLASVNGSGTFTADDQEGTLYWQRYELGQKDSAASGYTTDWYLKGITNLNLPTTSVEAIAASGALAYHTWRDHDQLLQRLGDLRQHGREEEGVWVRVKGGKLSRSDQFEFENKYTQYELGYDQKLKSTPAYTRYAGISFSYLDGDSSYSSGSGENKVKALNIYGTQIGAKGHYLDLVLKYSQLDNDFKVFDTSGNKITGDYDQNGLSISAEYGRKNNLKNNWYIEPQAQLTFGRLRGTDYTTSNGIRVDQDGIDSFVGRIGFNIGKDINEKTNIYLKANLMHEFGGGYNASMVDASGTKARLDRDFDDTWFEYGLGAAVQTGKNNYFYVDVERSAGSDYKKDWQWNVGARWSF
ncbi:MAG: autotransporter outer membrane beta-barrel domain-containing protein [Phascolarctobacterium faecium]|jgi:autotransporter|uniref:autotransporter family protein n=1 Tax=Phascolarctobacterium faecium TaxID=33025 RepID=UPI002E7912C8|nr:autotransporter outer membrane beta-barrel domain-containing protein [Phascolarctobacterium faecium]MED9991832.1 autotransporter outer membrane beta-barrel domain-containing protein [Phascolarctobacterium faecium]